MPSTDFFQKKGAGTVTTLAAPGKALGATSITVGSTANYPTDTGITIAIRIVDTAGKLVAGTYTEWKGVVASGTSLTIDAAPVYGNDQVYPSGSTTQVFIPLSEYSHNRMVDGLLVSHDQDGTLKAGAVDNAACLASDVVETAKIKDANVTAAKLATNLGYSVRSTAATSIVSLTDISGLAVTVTVPTGAKVLLTCFVAAKNKYSGINGIEVYIKEGATTLVTGGFTTPAINYSGSSMVGCVIEPTAGSHTYKVSAASVNSSFDTLPPSYIQATIIG